MEKLENGIQYESLMEFALFGKSNENIDLNTLIATKKIGSEDNKCH